MWSRESTRENGQRYLAGQVGGDGPRTGLDIKRSYNWPSPLRWPWTSCLLRISLIQCLHRFKLKHSRCPTTIQSENIVLHLLKNASLAVIYSTNCNSLQIASSWDVNRCITFTTSYRCIYYITRTYLKPCLYKLRVVSLKNKITFQLVDITIVPLLYSVEQ